jgi:L-alanine-DL-glutamate epimerase-like enolase superfamily enzyme
MRITDIEIILYEPTWDDPLAHRYRRTFAAITVQTDDGLTGISRTWEEEAHAIKELFTPALIGADPRNVERIWSDLYARTVPYLGQEGTLVAAIGALDIALWDLYGRSVGLPCWQLLGGYRDWIPAYADVPVRNETPEELAEQLAACVAAGYDAVKFHIINRDPDHIVRQARAAREAIGPNVKLMVDIFRALDPHTAAEVARRIEPYDIFWLEEPVRWHDQPLGLALVARGTRIPVAGGEGESTLFGCRAILEQSGVTYLQPDILSGGGYTNLRKMAALAEAYHAGFAPHGAGFPELCAPIVAAMPNGVMVPATTPDQPPAVWDHLYEDFAIRDGRIQLTDRPGLGLTFDQAFLARFRQGPSATGVQHRGYRAPSPASPLGEGRTP